MQMKAGVGKGELNTLWVDSSGIEMEFEGR